MPGDRIHSVAPATRVVAPAPAVAAVHTGVADGAGGVIASGVEPLAATLFGSVPQQ